MTFDRAIPSNEPPGLSLGELDLEKPCSDLHGFCNWNSRPDETQWPQQRFLGTVGIFTDMRGEHSKGGPILSANHLDRTVVIRAKHILHMTVSGHAPMFE